MGDKKLQDNNIVCFFFHCSTFIFIKTKDNYFYKNINKVIHVYGNTSLETCTDCMVVTFCSERALCQMGREIKIP